MLHIPIVHAHDISKQISQEKIFHWVENVIKQSVHTSATPRATLTHLLCTQNFLHASYLDEHTLTHEQIVNQRLHYVFM